MKFAPGFFTVSTTSSYALTELKVLTQRILNPRPILAPSNRAQRRALGG